MFFGFLFYVLVSQIFNLILLTPKWYGTSKSPRFTFYIYAKLNIIQPKLTAPDELSTNHVKSHDFEWED